MGKVIVIEDNPVFSGYVCRLLGSLGIPTATAQNCAGARKLFAAMREDDIVLSDLRLPDGDGILLLEELRRQGKQNPYIIMTDYDEVPTAVKSMKLGAEDYLPKRLLEERLPAMLEELRKRTERHARPIHERQSQAFRALDRRIGMVATTNMSVLVLGENGTGKEHVARKIHARSKRSGKPFVAVDCGTLPKELAASALFGHEKGAFTGADGQRKGYWAEAEGGTLFLDEIGNLPPEVQQMLLRAVQERMYRPVGGSRDRKADVRIIAATNEDMEAAVNEGRFRRDLYHRLKEFAIRIPPLRECKEDIMPLAEFFRELACKELDKRVKGFEREAERKLLAHLWRGNVRELEQAVRTAVLLSEGDTVTADTLELDEMQEEAFHDFDEKEKLLNRERLLHALEQAGGNRRKAAELLGMSPTTLYKKLDMYDIREKKQQR